MKRNLLLILSTIAFSFTILVIKTWKIADGYIIRFDGKYAHGTFEKLSGDIQFDPENPLNAKFDVSVDVNSINTGIELKNKHAKSEKWFDAAQFPVIRFVSTNVSKLDSGYVVNGELEMHGIRKPVSIPFLFKESEGKSLFQGTFKVNRGDFGIGKTTGKESDSTSVEVSVPVHAL
ncbi:YceI family protein [Dyadobacter sp. CY323]|uniref:YceI family protein n=1 Tax=Dyadobacter sp. CY323 TaxID=2907302 RepID=UPI001F288B65|nr:YceI family protein [Dyadobacter sp. CY323]MCE6990022.1 YceI family protein [Dyadobacter sp. CY323]